MCIPIYLDSNSYTNTYTKQSYFIEACTQLTVHKLNITS